VRSRARSRRRRRLSTTTRRAREATPIVVPLADVGRSVGQGGQGGHVVGRSGRSVVPRGCPPPIVLSRHHVTDRPQDRPTTGPTDHRTDRPQDHARAIYGAMDTSITSCALVLNVLNRLKCATAATAAAASTSMRRTRRRRHANDHWNARDRSRWTRISACERARGETNSTSKTSTREKGARARERESERRERASERAQKERWMGYERPRAR